MIVTLKNLRNARKEYDYSSKDMAIILGISESYYYQIENQKRNLDYSMVVKISSIFDLKPDELFYNYYEKDIKKNKIIKKELKVISLFLNL